MNKSFSSFELRTVLLHDYSKNQFPTRLWGFESKPLNYAGGGTLLGYCSKDTRLIRTETQTEYLLQEGMYFSIAEPCQIIGQGIAVERIGYKGFFQIGGAIEAKGRLKYIDGCTDSLLISPIKLGDPCLNLLHFPEGINQTPHTHPSMRVGMVVKGKGVCVTPEGNIDLVEGMVFIIHEEGIHSFRTEKEQEMTVIAYHPDSDFGATDEDHPMINRTIVDGVSAKFLDEIRTK